MLPLTVNIDDVLPRQHSFLVLWVAYIFHCCQQCCQRLEPLPVASKCTQSRRLESETQSRPGPRYSARVYEYPQMHFITAPNTILISCDILGTGLRSHQEGKAVLSTSYTAESPQASCLTRIHAEMLACGARDTAKCSPHLSQGSGLLPMALVSND